MEGISRCFQFYAFEVCYEHCFTCLRFPLRKIPKEPQSKHTFIFTRNMLLFQHYFTNMHSRQQCLRGLKFHCLAMLNIIKLIGFSSLMGIKWCLAAILICFFLITNEAKHHFVCLLVALVSSLWDASLLLSWNLFFLLMIGYIHILCILTCILTCRVNVLRIPSNLYLVFSLFFRLLLMIRHF